MLSGVFSSTNTDCCGIISEKLGYLITVIFLIKMHIIILTYVKKYAIILIEGGDKNDKYKHNKFS